MRSVPVRFDVEKGERESYLRTILGLVSVSTDGR